MLKTSFYFGLTSIVCIVLLLILQSELPLVGNVAPDFEAEAVFDQEFIKVDDKGFFLVSCY